MYKVIDSSQCNDNLVLRSMLPNYCCLIVSAEEIIYFREKNKVIIDKTLNYNNKPRFDYDSSIDFEEQTHILYEYNKQYLRLDYTWYGDSCLEQQYFFRGTNRALYLDNPIELYKTSTDSKVEILSREQIEQVFNKDMYDAMYIIKSNGTVNYCCNKTNGLVLDKKIIPSDDEIIKLSLKNKRTLVCDSTTDNIKIDDIENISIYGSPFCGNYTDILLTVSNGKFKLRWFNIAFIKNDKFKLSTKEIPIKESTVDDLLNFHIKYEEKLQKEINNQKVLKNWFRNI